MSRNDKRLPLAGVILVLTALTVIAACVLIRLENGRILRHSREVCAAVRETITGASAEIGDRLGSGRIADLPFAVHIYSHRGGAEGIAEEHSMAAYDYAVSCGSFNIEQDIVVSADGTLYVSHDLSPYRMTGTDRLYSDMTDDEIDSLRTHGGGSIIKLSDVFDRYGSDVNYIVELKDGGAVGAFADMVREYAYEDIVVAQCFEPEVLRELEDIFPDMKKLYLCYTQSDVDAGLAADYADIVSAPAACMNESNCEAAHERGKEFNVWTLDSDEQIETAIRLGVDSYFTNYTKRAFELEREFRR